jgi:2-polyprenyl-6-methoxyphenol hydroxylase-like FAD-dependent oxidoreductase
VYASAWFDPPTDIDDDWTVLATLPSMPRDARMGIAIRFSSGRMLCSVVDYGRPAAPQNTDALVARLADLCVPQIHRLLLASKPTSDVAVFGNTQNRWRRYGRLPSFPDGLVVIGDAVCSLNPRYGQGMTVASLSADRLDKELSAYFGEHQSLSGFSHHFQKKLEGVLTVPWQIALLEDRAWVSSLAGAEPSLAERIAVKSAQRVLKTAFSDVDTYIRFMRVAHLLDTPFAMLHPRTIAKIAGGGGAGPAADDVPGIGSA